MSSSSRRRPAAAGPPPDSQRPRPKKSLGQHFLSDRNIIRRIVDAAELRPGDQVIDIGAGLGGLTAELAGRGFEVTAVEIDRELAAGLRLKFEGARNVRVLEADALELDLVDLFGPQGRYSVVSNLPYNAGAAIVRRLLESEPRAQRLVVMLQKEVAESMLAPPGRLGLLAIGVQVFATGRKVFDVAPGAFLPPPKVRSSVIRLDARPEPLVPAAELKHFFEVARAGFSAPRKQLRNALANGLGIAALAGERLILAAGLDPSKRPQELSIQDWLTLSRAVGD